MNLRLQRDLLLQIKKSWKMVTLHCHQESNRTNVFCSNVLKETNVSPTASFLLSVLLLQVLMYSSLDGEVSVWIESSFYFQARDRPIHCWICHPCQPSPAGAHIVLHDLPTAHLQSNTPKMPGPLASWCPTDWGGLLGPCVLNPLFLPYGKLRAWCIAIYSASIHNCL